MFGIRVAGSFATSSVLCICEVVLHSFLEGVLGASDVGFACLFAFHLADCCFVAAAVVTVAASGVLSSAVAGKGFEVTGGHVGVDFVGQVPI